MSSLKTALEILDFSGAVFLLTCAFLFLASFIGGMIQSTYILIKERNGIFKGVAPHIAFISIATLGWIAWIVTDIIRNNY